MSSDATTKTPSLRQVLGAALAGTFVEWFDFALFAYTTPIFAVLYFGAEDPAKSLLYTFGVVYGVSFVFRPLGGLFWGHLGDRVGRRSTLAIVIVAMGVATTLVALVPPKAAIGMAAPLFIVVLRIAQAFCASGESVGAGAFVLEHTAPNRRGLWLGLLNSFAVVPSACGALIVVAMTALLGPEAFMAWGWRVLFVVGGLVAVVGLYIRRRLPETDAFTRVAESGAQPKVPALVALREYPRRVFAVFAMIGIAALAFYVLSGFISAYLSEGLKLSREAALLSNAAAVLALGILGTLFGALSDKLMRRKPLILAGVAILAVGAVPAFFLASEFGWQGALAGQLLIALGIAVTWGGGVPFMQESFPTRVRYSGAAVSYNAAYAVLAGTAPLVSQYLVTASGVATAPGFYMAGMSVLALIALALLAKETAGVDLLQAGDKAGESSRVQDAS